ncbi:MAG: tetratricopeptide repeat protein [Nodosilinea sp. LVE1205-7]
MLYRTVLFPLLTLTGLLASPLPVYSQALTPYLLPLDYKTLADQGRFLANQAQQLGELRQSSQALALAQLAVQLAPNDGQVIALLGGLYLQNDQIDQAITLLERAKTLIPDNGRVLFSLGSAYFQKGNYRQSATYLEQGLKLEPNNPNAHFDLGNAYFKLQKYPQAMASYSASVKIQPDFWPAVNNIGLVLYEQRQITSALEKWTQALALAGGKESEPKLAMAIGRYAQDSCRVAAHASSDRCQKAITLGVEALEQDSRYGQPEFLEKISGAPVWLILPANFSKPLPLKPYSRNFRPSLRV